MNTQRQLLVLIGLALVLGAGGCMDPVIADAGTDRTVDAGQTVTLDGSGSRPEQNGRLDYLWEVVEGPETTIASPTAERTSFTAPSVDRETSLRVRLTVTYIDLAGTPYAPNSDTDEVIIRVHADRDGDAADTTAETEDLTTDGAGDEVEPTKTDAIT